MKDYHGLLARINGKYNNLRIHLLTDQDYIKQKDNESVYASPWPKKNPTSIYTKNIRDFCVIICDFF